MTERWRVILVEDSPSDAKLIAAELERGGVELDWIRIESADALQAALCDQTWDLILSDWSLPGFSGLAALELVKQSKLDVPFIIVSGTVGEEIAVAAMRAGASDYVLKDKLTRLWPAAQREVREARGRSARRAAEQALRNSEEQLRQAQKMEAVGRLAAGIAHDFNNLLSVILGYGELLLARLHDEAPLRTELLHIHEAASRATELTRQLLIFSRQQVLEPKLIDLNELLRSLARMLDRVLGEDIELHLRLGDQLCGVFVDPHSMEQAIMNLVVNARDAMPRGGKLSVSTCETDFQEADAAERVGLQRGSYVTMTVTDTGIGMDAATRARIFEPFFTTKDTNNGTGLGLSTVLGIVQQSRGNVRVDSEPGLGTTFTVYLPCYTGEIQRHAPLPRAEPVRGDETILLVEDDPQVRLVTGRILDSFGYQVIEVRSFAEARKVCAEHPTPIHLLLTDVVMPGISGPQLARELTALRPSMRVLYMSGYTDDSVLRHGISQDQIAYLQKPLTAALLTRKVREVLERRRTSEFPPITLPSES